MSMWPICQSRNSKPTFLSKGGKRTQRALSNTHAREVGGHKRDEWNYLFKFFIRHTSSYISVLASPSPPPQPTLSRRSCCFLLMSPCQFNDRIFHAMSTYARRGQFRIVGHHVGSVDELIKGHIRSRKRSPWGISLRWLEAIKIGVGP